MAFDCGEIACRARSRSGSPTSSRRSSSSSVRTGRRVSRSRSRPPSAGRSFNDTLPADYPFVNYEVGKKAMGAIINDLAERYTKVEVAASLDALKDTGFHWATRSGVTVSIDDVTTPDEEGRDPGRVRRAGQQGPEAVRARPRHRRGASPGAGRDLDPGLERRGQGDGEVLRPDQPDLHDGRLGCLRKHDADPPGGGDAWSRGQPARRHHPAADQGELPRGPVRAGVLHLHARCPQGSGRHRAPYGGLRLPDPSSRRRVAGRHHP